MLKLLALCSALVALTGCGPGSSTPSAPRIPHTDLGGLERFGPDEYGVVCYQRYTGSAPLDCVKVNGVTP